MLSKSKLKTEVKRQFMAARELVRPLIERRKKSLDLYTGFFAYNELENADAFKENVPYTKTLLDNTLPLLVQKLPQSKVSPRDSAKYYAPAKLMDKLITFTFDANDFHDKFPLNEKEAMLAGDHLSKIIWNPDPNKNYPLITSIDINNVSVHPAKLELDDEFPLFVRREMTKQQMKEETNWDHDAINSLGEPKLKDRSYRKEQMVKLGLPPDKTKNGGVEDEEWNLYEVVERWGMMEFKNSERKMGCVVLANGEAILNDKPYLDELEPYESPFANDVMPFAQLPYDRLPNSFWSMSFIDPIASQQIELNDLEAMKKSNYVRRNNPPFLVGQSANLDLSSAKMLSGLPWMVDDINAVKPFELPDLAPSIELQQAMIRRTMMNVTGATDILMTAPEDQGTKGSHKVQSAAHAQILQESIKTRFILQAMNVDRYVERIGKLLINLWQDERYWTGMEGNKIALAIADNEGNNSTQDVTWQDIQGELDFVVTAASSIAQSPAAEATQAANLLQLLLPSPFAKDLNFEPFLKKMIDNSGFDYTEVKKPDASNLPQLTQKLDQIMLQIQQPNFKTLPPVEQLKLIQSGKMLQQKIAELQQKAGSQGQQPPGQPVQPQPGTQPGPEQTVSGQQLQPQGAQ